MVEPDTITSVPVVAALALAMRGFWPYSLKHPTRELRLFFTGMMLIIGGKALLILYWSTFRGVIIDLDPELWHRIVLATGGARWINTGFNVVFFIGAVYMLMAFKEMIPAHERDRWSIWTAPFYPHGWCVRRKVNRLSGKWKS